MYLYDFEDFLRNEGLEGLNLNGFIDDILLLFEDDTAILASTFIDLLRKLNALEKYCEINGSVVNIDKIKIMIFKAKGKPQVLKEQYRMFISQPIEIVKNYDYLGVKMSTSSFGLTAAGNAVKKKPL